MRKSIFLLVLSLFCFAFGAREKHHLTKRDQSTTLNNASWYTTDLLSGQWKYFDFSIRSKEYGVVIMESTQGDPDIYLAKGREPTMFEHDLYNIDTRNRDILTVAEPARWTAGIYAFTNATFRIMVLIKEPLILAMNDPISAKGKIQNGQKDFYMITTSPPFVIRVEGDETVTVTVQEGDIPTDKASLTKVSKTGKSTSVTFRDGSPSTAKNYYVSVTTTQSDAFSYTIYAFNNPIQSITNPGAARKFAGKLQSGEWKDFRVDLSTKQYAKLFVDFKLDNCEIMISDHFAASSKSANFSSWWDDSKNFRAPSQGYWFISIREDSYSYSWGSIESDESVCTYSFTLNVDDPQVIEAGVTYTHWIDNDEWLDYVVKIPAGARNFWARLEKPESAEGRMPSLYVRRGQLPSVRGFDQLVTATFGDTSSMTIRYPAEGNWYLALVHDPTGSYVDNGRTSVNLKVGYQEGPISMGFGSQYRAHLEKMAWRDYIYKVPVTTKTTTATRKPATPFELRMLRISVEGTPVLLVKKGGYPDIVEGQFDLKGDSFAVFNNVTIASPFEGDTYYISVFSASNEVDFSLTLGNVDGWRPRTENRPRGGAAGDVILLILLSLGGLVCIIGGAVFVHLRKERTAQTFNYSSVPRNVHPRDAEEPSLSTQAPVVSNINGKATTLTNNSPDDLL